MVAEGGGVERVAHHLDRGKTHVHSWTDPQTRDHISFRDARRLTALTRSAALAELLAADCGAYVQRLEPPQMTFVELFSKAMRAKAEIVAQLIERGPMAAADRLAAVLAVPKAQIEAGLAAFRKAGMVDGDAIVGWLKFREEPTCPA
jgi:ribonuclease HII